MHTNQRLLAEELVRRGISLEVLDAEIELLKASYQGHQEFLLDRYSSLFPFPVTKLSSDKIFVKNMLERGGLAVPQGRHFDIESIKYALEYAEYLGFPLVLKPNWGSYGNNVYIGIASIQELKTCLKDLFSALGKKIPFLLERQFTGQEYRIFITKEGKYAVAHRDPAHVIGDGKHTIQQLAEIESAKRTDRSRYCLYPIVIDSAVEAFLKKNGKTLGFVPQPGENVYLRFSSNIAKGASCSDVTDKFHPTVIEIAKRVLTLFQGLPYVGIDLMTKDITAPHEMDSYVIVEINANPSFSLHMLPANGQPRNVAAWVADLIFPETRAQKLS
jgi:cyanophycin synthetase